MPVLVRVRWPSEFGAARSVAVVGASADRTIELGAEDQRRAFWLRRIVVATLPAPPIEPATRVTAGSRFFEGRKLPLIDDR